jgi:glycosyltransferase involved in cell wall biosynthesis
LKNPISIYLICGNEEAYIGRCLESFKPMAEEFVVCISRGSLEADKTEEIALAHGARVVHYKNKKTDWKHIDDFASARNTALEACKNEWALWVDADDVMQPGAEALVDDAIEEANKRGADLIAFRYDVQNAGLIPLREMASRKGKCHWKNRVHEMLVAKDSTKMFGIDKVVRVHKPHGYKKASADRNFAILKDTLEPAPNSLYYTQQEYFLSMNWEKCLEFGAMALMFPELEDTLRYDVLCNMGRCSKPEERLKYLGQAITLQPDRREAYYWAGLEYAGRGQWVKAWGSARAAMSLPRPSSHYWNQVEAIYNWQAMDLYETASVCVGKTDEANKMKKMKPAPRITMVHATKGRPQVAWQRRFQWLSLAQKPLEVEWLFMVDHDDAIDYTPHQAIRCNPGGIINAWNHGAKLAKSDIIVQMSDDWSPPRHWDASICSLIGSKNEDKVLAVSDGYRTDKLLCMAILNKKRLETQGGWLFHPDYQESDGLYSDNEFTERAYADGVVVEARDLKFVHENPIYTQKEADKQLVNHNKPEFYEKGKAIYEKRKANSWS